ncbi:MAG: DUF4148 domain-containing protein [Burkholderiaceae bacterium]
MKKFAIATAILASSFAAFADGAVYEQPQSATSTVSRATVLADLSAVRADGAIPSGEMYLFTSPNTGTSLTRAEVRSELSAALANDSIQDGEGAVMRPLGA